MATTTDTLKKSRANILQRGRIHGKFRGQSSEARVTHKLCNPLPHTLNAASTRGAGAQLGMEVSTGLKGVEEPSVHSPDKGEPQDGPLCTEKQTALADNASELAKGAVWAGGAYRLPKSSASKVEAVLLLHGSRIAESPA